VKVFLTHTLTQLLTGQNGTITNSIMIRTHRDIIAAFGSAAEYGRATSIAYEAARKHAQRGYIPAKYWPDVIAACRKRGIKGVTAEVLLAGLCSRPTAGDAESSERPAGNVNAAEAA